MTNQEQPRASARILIVEDNPDVAEVLQDLLATEGYLIDRASTLAAALPKIRSVDLTLLDLLLPDGNALDLCRLLRATPELSRHPIILLSARGSAADRARGLKAGADDYLAKPYDAEELLARVRTLLHTRRIEADLRRHARQLSALRLVNHILVTVEVAELAQRVTNAVPEIFGADSAVIGGMLCVVDDDAHALRVHAMTDSPTTRGIAQFLDRPIQDYQCSVDPPANLLQRVAFDGNPQEAAHLADFISPGVARSTAQQIEALIGMRGGAAMPIRAQGQQVGVFLFALSKPVAEITSLERELMRDYLDSIGIALENVRLYSEAAKLMVTDHLTGLANRRRFDQALEEELSRARGLGYPVGLLVIDVDGFKNFNDRYGHQFGDRILRAVGQALAGSVRQTDLVARYGGEEFTVILPGTPVSGLSTVGEKLRQAVRSLRVDDTQQVDELTLSIGGAAAMPPHFSAEALIRDADDAMYLAKAVHDCVQVIDRTGREPPAQPPEHVPPLRRNLDLRE